jgi:hypothetical protein
LTARNSRGDNKAVKPETAGEESIHKSKFAIKIITRGAIVRLTVLAVFVTIFCVWAEFAMIKMPGKS